MAHLVHIPLRRRLKSALLIFGFALFVVMAVLTAHQASDPKLSRGRHAATRPIVAQTVPAASASGGAIVQSLTADEQVASNQSATPPPSTSAATPGPVAEPQSTTGDAQSAALSQALTLSANLRAAAHQHSSTPAGRQ
jgi:hypothetical protein